jgi:SAM-dependent methyltransferase
MASVEPAQQEMRELDVLLRLGSLHTPMAVRVAATLRLVDHINAGVNSPAELAKVTGTNANALLRIIRHLVAVGIFEETGPGQLEPTTTGRLLADDHPAQQRAWFDLNNAVSRADLVFLRLLDAVRTGRPAYESVYGQPFYDDLTANPELAESFDALMACDQDLAYDAPAAAYDWNSAKHVLDVGGGSGGFLIAIAKLAPHIRGTLLELPLITKRGAEQFKAAGLDDRMDAVAADFFEPLPVKADVILLSFVLLNWSDDDARRILRRCTDALEPGGRILVLERDDLAEDASNEKFTILDLRMLVFLGGRLRTRDEWSTFAASAGLTVESAEKVASPSVPFDLSLLVLAPNGEKA